MITEKEMRVLIENYSRNLAMYQNALEKSRSKMYNTKITAAYGLNTGGGSNSFNSKVENKMIEHNEIESNLIEYKRRVNIVDKAQYVLTSSEQEIIEFIKLGITYQLSVIARLIHKNKKYVFDTRNRAIKKMCDYIG